MEKASHFLRNLFPGPVGPIGGNGALKLPRALPLSSVEKKLGKLQESVRVAGGEEIFAVLSPKPRGQGLGPSHLIAEPLVPNGLLDADTLPFGRLKAILREINFGQPAWRNLLLFGKDLPGEEAAASPGIMFSQIPWDLVDRDCHGNRIGELREGQT